MCRASRRRVLELAGIAGIVGAAGCSGLPFTGSDTTSGRVTKLTSPDGSQTSRFGTAVALDGDTAVVGAPAGKAEGVRTEGLAYVFERVDGEWQRTDRLVAESGDAQDYTGSAVALDGDTALVGAPRDEGPNGPKSGSAYVFARGDGDDGWRQTAALGAANAAPGAQFGTAVALDGDAALVGAPFHVGYDTPGSGLAYVFERVDGGWRQPATVVPEDDGDRASLGSAVALSGATGVVGAPMSQEPREFAGSAHVIERIDGEWRQTTRLTGDGDARDRFGRSAAVDGETIVVGAFRDRPRGVRASSGAAYVFERDDGWRQTARLAPDDDAVGWFGFSVTTTGDTVVVGAPQSGTGGEGAGLAMSFERDDGWQQTSRLTGTDQDANDEFGSAVARRDGTTVVGAPGDEGHPDMLESGSAYVFDR